MISQKLSYDAVNFPFAGVLDELTQLLQHTQLGPVAAYAKFQQLRKARGLLSGADYCSTAITSSGHARRPGINKTEVIRKNTENARQLVVELVAKGSLHPSSVVVPVDLGYIPTWQQSDYITFWLAVIAGLDLGKLPRSGAIAKLETTILGHLRSSQVDLNIMNNHSVSLEVRALEYFKFSHAFAKTAAAFRPEPNSAHRVVNLIDTEESLGCQTERLFAQLRGIPIYGLAITGPAQSLHPAFQDKSLVKDLSLLEGYGSKPIEINKAHSFALRHQAVAEMLTNP